ncbi:MAG: STAS domain-containing protein [Deltaproteobacteria bacterium]|nr:STAS domain-containing protein [Deltaproteobacteria bacterium]MBF0527421.1 STAS domain-containing protein [Deltaproteobacteria bacterium]
MTVKTNQSDDGKTLTISLTGRFDYTIYSSFVQAYKDSLKLPSQVVVELAKVECMDASALGMLLVLRAKAIANNTEIVLSHCAPSVKENIQTHGAGRLFKLD